MQTSALNTTIADSHLAFINDWAPLPEQPVTEVSDAELMVLWSQMVVLVNAPAGA